MEREIDDWSNIHILPNLDNQMRHIKLEGEWAFWDGGNTIDDLDGYLSYPCHIIACKSIFHCMFVFIYVRLFRTLCNTKI